jgi:hypothetical protein
MPIATQRPEAPTMAAVTIATAVAIAANPQLVSLVTARVHYLLQTGDNVAERAPWEHVSTHFAAIQPEILADTEISAVAQKAVDAANQNGALELSASAITAGALIGAIIVIGIIHYCIEGPHPEPGTSEPTVC